MSILDLIILVPILGAVAIAFRAPARSTALAAAAANAALGVIAAFSYFADQTGGAFRLAASRPILTDPELSFAVGVDGMSLILLLLTVVVTLCAVAVSPERPPRSPGMYHASSLLISAGALGAFLSTDLFFFYAFHELALIPTFLMIGIFGRGDRRAAAWKVTIYLGLGSLVLLAGLIAVHLNFSGERLTFDMRQLAENARSGAVDVPAATQEWIFLVLLVGFGILISLFPFHSWAAPAYAAAPTPTAMLHAGVLKKFGLYGLLRVAVPMLPLGASADWIQKILLVLLLGNILFVGLVTIAQKRLDFMLANSSVMHMGYVFLGIASLTTIGLQGAVLLMFAHGLSIALLFALCGMVEEKTGTLEFERLGGLARSAPLLGLAFGFAAFASIGLPGFANFASEVMIFFGAFRSFSVASGFGPLQVATILALWGVVISAVYMLRAYGRIFQGEATPAAAKAVDIPFGQRWPLILLIAVLLVVGFYPNLLLQLLSQGDAAVVAHVAELP